jgi:hypothetical protein
MFTHLPFPVTLPTLAFAITLVQRREILDTRVGLRIFLPGDSEDEASIQAEAGEMVEGAILSEMDQRKAAVHPDARTPPGESYPSMKTILRFQQLVIKQPGLIKVRAVVGENIVRLGSLAVSPAPQPQA